MKVLMVEAGKHPYLKEIGEELKNLQDAVGGMIQAVYPWDDPVGIICNEEGKLIGLPVNRLFRDGTGKILNILVGDFFVCGVAGEKFCDIPA